MAIKNEELYECLDYRDYLKSYLDDLKEKKSWSSYRWAAQRMGIDDSLLIRILQKKRHLSNKNFEVVNEFLGFKNYRAKYFSTLILFNKSKSEEQAQKYYEELSLLRAMHLPKVESSQLAFYDKWYYNALRNLLFFYEFKGRGYDKLAAALHPPISKEQSKEGIDLLKKLKMIVKDENKCFRPSEQFITGGGNWRMRAVKQFQKETMELSLRSLAEDPPELRDISSLTLAVPQSAMAYISDQMAEFRRKILSQVAEMDNGEVVIQVNMQMIPLSVQPSENNEEVNDVKD